MQFTADFTSSGPHDVVTGSKTAPVIPTEYVLHNSLVENNLRQSVYVNAAAKTGRVVVEVLPEFKADGEGVLCNGMIYVVSGMGRQIWDKVVEGETEEAKELRRAESDKYRTGGGIRDSAFELKYFMTPDVLLDSSVNNPDHPKSEKELTDPLDILAEKVYPRIGGKPFYALTRFQCETAKGPVPAVNLLSGDALVRSVAEITPVISLLPYIGGLLVVVAVAGAAYFFYDKKKKSTSSLLLR